MSTWQCSCTKVSLQLGNLLNASALAPVVFYLIFAMTLSVHSFVNKMCHSLQKYRKSFWHTENIRFIHSQVINISNTRLHEYNDRKHLQMKNGGNISSTKCISQNDKEMEKLREKLLSDPAGGSTKDAIWEPKKTSGWIIYRTANTSFSVYGLMCILCGRVITETQRNHPLSANGQIHKRRVKNFPCFSIPISLEMNKFHQRIVLHTTLTTAEHVLYINQITYPRKSKLINWTLSLSTQNTLSFIVLRRHSEIKDELLSLGLDKARFSSAWKQLTTITTTLSS